MSPKSYWLVLLCEHLKLQGIRGNWAILFFCSDHLVICLLGFPSMLVFFIFIFSGSFEFIPFFLLLLLFTRPFLSVTFISSSSSSFSTNSAHWRTQAQAVKEKAVMAFSVRPHSRVHLKPTAAAAGNQRNCSMPPLLDATVSGCDMFGSSTQQVLHGWRHCVTL